MQQIHCHQNGSQFRNPPKVGEKFRVQEHNKKIDHKKVIWSSDKDIFQVKET